jgi:hypothetical protein
MPKRDNLSMRLRLHYRIGLALAQAVVPALSWVLVRSHAAIGVAVLMIAIMAWLGLAFRTWRESAMLTAGTLEIRNIFRTVRLDVTSVSGVWFSRGALRISVAEGGARSGRHSGGRQYVVAAVRLGAAHWSGRRTAADEFADALAVAAGLAPLARRGQPASGRQVRAGLATGAMLTAAGIAVVAFAQLVGGIPGMIVRLLGGGLLYAAGLMLYPVTMVAMDRFFGRRRVARAAALVPGREISP